VIKELKELKVKKEIQVQGDLKELKALKVLKA
jgi:hypothetical protein